MERLVRSQVGRPRAGGFRDPARLEQAERGRNPALLGHGGLSQDVRRAQGRRGQRLYLDLGVVKNLAQVRLNGRDLGVVWCAPWRVDITGAVKARDNQLEVAVANLWPNRLIGDQSLPPEKRLTSTTWNPFKKGLAAAGVRAARASDDTDGSKTVRLPGRNQLGLALRARLLVAPPAPLSRIQPTGW